MWFWISLASIALNIFLFLYIRWLLKTIEAVNDDMIVLTDMLAEYSKHIESVYELEMFYGDETLKSLMSHSKGFLERIKDVDLIINETANEIEGEESTDATPKEI